MSNFISKTRINLRNSKNRALYKLDNFIHKQKQLLSRGKRFVPKTQELIDCFQLSNDVIEKTLLTSFYRSNMSASVISYQKKVFDLFGLPIVQVTSSQTHAEFLRETLLKTEKEFVLFFDIDAIPLQKEAIFLALKDLQQNFTITAALQTASHLNNGKNNYAGPFFLGIKTAFYKECGAPSLEFSDEYDVAGILSDRAIKLSKAIKYWVPTHVERRKWNLYRVGDFGLGTTYNGMIYHAFEGREGNTFSFINKCKRVLKNYK